MPSGSWKPLKKEQIASNECIYQEYMPLYCTTGNIGGQLNLAVWLFGKRPSNLNPSNLSVIYATYVLFYVCACTHIICTELPPNLNPPIFFFRPLGTKPPNLKIANISGYTVCAILASRFPTRPTRHFFLYPTV